MRQHVLIPCIPASKDWSNQVGISCVLKYGKSTHRRKWPIRYSFERRISRSDLRQYIASSLAEINGLFTLCNCLVIREYLGSQTLSLYFYPEYSKGVTTAPNPWLAPERRETSIIVIRQYILMVIS